ncbi:MAG: ABC transporter substrate-binding protein [Chloroflexota bacterium]
MKRIKWLVFLTLVCALVLSTNLFAAPVHAQKALVIGFAQTGSESGWRTAFTDSMKAEATKEGIDLKFSDGQQKQEVQIAAIRSFIAQKVDAILLAPIVETGWDAVLKEAKDAKIPVILVDRGVKVADDSLYVTRVAADFTHEGALAGAWLAAASAGTQWASSCNIVELQGTVGSSAALDRAKGFNDMIALFPTMKIVASQSGDFTRDGGQKVMEGFIKSQNNLKDVCAIWAHNDDMLLGALVALKAAGIKTGPGGILTISVDGVCDMFKAMADGDTNANVTLLPDLGPLAYQAAKDAIAGKSVEKRILMPSPMNFPDSAAAKYAKCSAK